MGSCSPATDSQEKDICQEAEASLGTYEDDSRRDEAPADLEEEGRWEPQHHLDVLKVVPVSWREGCQWAGRPRAGAQEAMDVRHLP